MPPDERFGQPKFAAQGAHLILEQFAQRLNQFHVHLLGQAADIMVALIVTDGPPENDTLSITSG